MAEQTEQETIKLLAGLSSAGERVYEELPVEVLADGCVRLRVSPGLVEGLARDDIIKPGNDGAFKLVERGGRVSVQIYFRGPIDDPVAFRNEVESCSGLLDGLSDKLLVMSWPSSIGFGHIENSISLLLSGLEDPDWVYGNVYDEVDGVTPLNWWMK